MVIGILITLILINGLFAMAEVAVVTSRQARLKQQASEGSRQARMALKLARNPTRFLATVQIGITVIGILSGAYAEENLSQSLTAQIEKISFLAPWADVMATAILVILLTYFSLVVGELLPKRIALMHPEGIAKALALPMRWLSRIANPAVKLLSFSTDALVKLLQIKQPEESTFTPDELMVLIEEGASAGVFDKTEHDIMSNVFRLAERRASSMMTPRKEISWIDLKITQERLREVFAEEQHAFYPVAQDNLDNVVGVLSVKDVLTRALEGETIDVEHLMRKALIVPESISLLEMLDAFRTSPSQVALIADEYGSTTGLVTQNDIVEAIVGEMPSSGEAFEPELVQREDGSYLVSGGMAADDLRQKLRLPDMPAANHYDTVAGFVMMQLQRIPDVGDSFEWNDIRFEVVDMDGKRVDKVLISGGANLGKQMEVL